MFHFGSVLVFERTVEKVPTDECIYKFSHDLLRLTLRLSLPQNASIRGSSPPSSGVVGPSSGELGPLLRSSGALVQLEGGEETMGL